MLIKPHCSNFYLEPMSTSVGDSNAEEGSVTLPSVLADNKTNATNNENTNANDNPPTTARSTLPPRAWEAKQEILEIF